MWHCRTPSKWNRLYPSRIPHGKSDLMTFLELGGKNALLQDVLRNFILHGSNSCELDMYSTFPWCCVQLCASVVMFCSWVSDDECGQLVG